MKKNNGNKIIIRRIGLRLRELITVKRVIIAAVIVFLFLVFVHEYNDYKLRDSYKLISYTEYLTLLERGDIDTVEYSEKGKYMYISLHNDITRSMTLEEREKNEDTKAEYRKVYYPGGEDFTKDLLERDVLVKKETPMLEDKTSLIKVSFLFCLVVVWYMLIKRVIPSSGSAVIDSHPDDIDISFDDVIGHEEVKKDLKLLVKQMKSNDESFRKLTHGILFEGSPGTGKTMLAKALAKEAGYNFISVNASSLIELYVGVGAKRIREVFDKARRKSPCIVFFDEIDSVGKRRGSRRGSSEDDQTINAMLAEMDGFTSHGDIIVIAATNRVADLDPALVRAGRFDRTISINVPTRWETRKELFDHYLSENELDESVDMESIAKQTVGYSGADIAAICREANMIMYSKDKDILTHDELEEAIDKIVFKGNRSSTEYSDTMEYVAYHEAGHAIMTMLSNKKVARISVMGMTSGIGGAVFQADEGSGLHSKKDIEQRIRVLYAGRASEELRFGRDNITDGASNDITEATKMILNYITKYGFDDSGMIDYFVLDEEGIINPDTTKRMAELSNKFYEETKGILEEHLNAVETLANKLLEVKTLSGDELMEMDLI